MMEIKVLEKSESSIKFRVRGGTQSVLNLIKEEADSFDEVSFARRIGLGIMGLANMLISMNLKYDSDKAIEFVDYLMKRIKETAYDESSNLAKEKGSFPAFVAEKLHCLTAIIFQ